MMLPSCWISWASPSAPATTALSRCCASLGQEYALRVSPAFYNTPEEIDALLDGLRRVLPLCTT